MRSGYSTHPTASGGYGAATFGLVPLLWPDVETLISPANDASDGVVLAQQREHLMEVAVSAGGNSRFSLDDGTHFYQSASRETWEPSPSSESRSALHGAMTSASSEADLEICTACYFRDPNHRSIKFATLAKDDEITLGPLVLRVRNSPRPKHYVFSVRY